MLKHKGELPSNLSQYMIFCMLTYSDIRSKVADSKQSQYMIFCMLTYSSITGSLGLNNMSQYMIFCMLTYSPEGVVPTLPKEIVSVHDFLYAHL